MGKTSLLYKMNDVVSKDLKDKIKAFCLFVSLNPWYCKNWDVFCINFLTQLKKTAESSTGIETKLRKELKNWKITFSLWPITVERGAGEREKEKSNLVESLEEFWKRYLEPSGVEVGLFFLDDIHYFLMGGSPDAYFTLRNNFQELVRRGCNFSLIATGPELLIRDTDLAEPFVRFFHLLYLEPFDLKGTEEAIKQRIAVHKLDLNFTKDVTLAIYEKSRGHPYFIMFIMYELLNMLGPVKTVNKCKFDNCWPSLFSKMGRTIFTSHLRNVPEKELEVLKKVAQFDKQLVSPSMVNIKGATELFLRLERKGLLLKKGRGLYEIFHPLLKEYLRNQDFSE